MALRDKSRSRVLLVTHPEQKCSLAAIIGFMGLNVVPTVTGFQAQKSESGCLLAFWLRSKLFSCTRYSEGPLKVYQVFKVLN